MMKRSLSAPLEKRKVSYKIHVTGNIQILTLKAPVTTAADDFHKYFSLFFRENKT